MGTQNVIKNYQNSIYQYQKRKSAGGNPAFRGKQYRPLCRLYLVSGISPENTSGHGNKEPEQEVSTSGCGDKVMGCTWFHSRQRQ
jgi:hypothetical protein